MMFKFGERSAQILATADEKLQTLCNEVIKHYDFSVIEGTRSLQRQQELYRDGKSQIDGVINRGKHNYMPSLAIDVLPYKKGHNTFDGSDESELMFWRMLWHFERASVKFGIPIRLGAFWSFKDFPHIELA